MGRMLEMQTVEEQEARDTVISELQDHIFELETNALAREEVIRGFTVLYARNGLATVDSVPDDLEDSFQESPRTTDGDEDRTPGTEGALGTRTGAAPESSHDEGVDDIRTDVVGSKPFELSVGGRGSGAQRRNRS